MSGWQHDNLGHETGLAATNRVGSDMNHLLSFRANGRRTRARPRAAVAIRAVLRNAAEGRRLLQQRCANRDALRRRRPDVVDSEPFDHVRIVTGGELEGVARAFVDIIDAKSPYTYRHSTRVADIARGVAEIAGIDAAGQDRLFRAALLHDIGKLGVSSRTLDKPAALTPDERRGCLGASRGARWLRLPVGTHRVAARFSIAHPRRCGCLRGADG